MATKTVLVLLTIVATASAFPSLFSTFEDHDGFQARVPALPCNATECVLPSCRCSSTDIPGSQNVTATPQFVILNFDDAVQVVNIDFYRNALDGRKNPNNCSVSGTFFIAHEYTDYTLVHELHSKGHEIGLHSMTHNALEGYWKNATVETLTREFADQRQTTANFANIPAADIKGIRIPTLQMAGNNQMEMLSRNNFTYDFTRGTKQFMKPGLWPYTHKYASIQDCVIEQCSNDSYPNVWTIPLIYWNNDNGNNTCPMVDGCVNYLNRTDNVFEWMKTEFLKQYSGNRAPFSVYLHAAWFMNDETRFTQYIKFLDYLRTLPDVYISSASQVIDWIKAPKTVAQMKDTPCHRTYTPDCSSRTCQLLNDEGQERWFTSCAQGCPPKYPWLGNPLGN